MTSGKYDLVLGLGSACSCTQVLRACGLQLASFPLDWVSGADLPTRVEIVLSGFEDWLRAEDFVQVDNPGAFRHDCYRNKKTQLVYPHDFEQTVPFKACYPLVRDKYARRAARLLGLLRAARRVLLVWIGDPRDATPVTREMCESCRRRFAATFSQATFEMIAVNCTRGAVASIDEAEGLVLVSADTASKDPQAKPWEIDQALVESFFRQASVRDYRTAVERRRYRQIEKAREYERYAARNALDCLCTKIRLKIYKHLRKALLKRGVRLEYSS